MNISTLNSDYVIEFAILEPTARVSITEFEETIDPTSWCCGQRLGRNFVRVSSAGILSTAGALITGFFPVGLPVFAGGAVSGIGNGASTWLAWEKKETRLLEARMMTDLPKVTTKIESISLRVNSILDTVQLILKEKDLNILAEDLEEVVHESSILDDDNKLPFFWNTKHRRNFIRLCIAGSFSAAGGWLGGFVPKTGGIIAGGILSGIGNAISTWLAYEQTNDAVIEKRALEEFPKLVEIAQKTEEKLLSIIERIKALKPAFLIDYKPIIATQVVATEEEECGRCVWGLREERNFWYINLAGWMSASGGWVAGLYPTIAGILIGGALGASANSLSTWLAFEKINDEEIERIATEDFPKIALNIIDLHQRVMGLEAYVALLEKQSLEKPIPKAEPTPLLDQVI